MKIGGIFLEFSLWGAMLSSLRLQIIRPAKANRSTWLCGDWHAHLHVLSMHWNFPRCSPESDPLKGNGSSPWEPLAKICLFLLWQKSMLGIPENLFLVLPGLLITQRAVFSRISHEKLHYSWASVNVKQNFGKKLISSCFGRCWQANWLLLTVEIFQAETDTLHTRQLRERLILLPSWPIQPRPDSCQL